MRRLKICVIGPTYPYRGGISHYNSILCEHLSKKHEVSCISFKRLYPTFLFPGKDTKDLESKEKVITNCREIIDSLNPITWLKAFSEIKKEKPDLLLMYWWTPFFSPIFFTIGLLVKKFTGIKVLFLCHNVLPHEKTFIDRILSKSVLYFADYFIVHSGQDAEDLKQMLPHSNVIVSVHPTYDIFNYKLIKKEKAKKALGLEGNVLLFFGFVRRYKGLEYLIKAMPIILKKKDVSLIIAGEFWELKKEILNDIKRLNLEKKVKIFDKYILNEEIGKYYCAADVVVLPYTHATNSGIVQTAFGFHKPVIVTAVGGLPEAVINGKTGFIVPPKNPRAIANAVIKYYKDNKEKEFIKEIKNDSSRFSWDNMVNNIESFFKE